MSEPQSYLITGPPMSDKKATAREITNNQKTTFNSSLTISTESDRLTENCHLFPIGQETTPPNDLTKIGIEISKWFENHDSPNIIFLEDLSTFEMYLKSESIFRFIHVLNKRIQSENSIFIATYTTTDDTINVYKELFDEHIETNQ